MQAITQYEYMYSRSVLSPKSKSFRPLYRSRNFDKTSRVISKYLNPFIWYRDMDVKDPYLSRWKKDIIRKTNRGKKHSKIHNGTKDPGNNKNTTTSIFVPWTPRDELSDLIKGCEAKCLKFSD